MLSIETPFWLLLVPFCLILASCAHTVIPDAETLDGFTANVYPSPLRITRARKAEATRLGNELGLHLLSATDKAEIGISDRTLHLEKTDGVWRFTRIIAGSKTTKLGLDHMLGGSPAITVPLTSLRKGRNRPWEKELILSGQRDGVKLEIVLRVSWRGPFITTDIHLSNEEEIPDLDFWIGFGLKIEGDDRPCYGAGQSRPRVDRPEHDHRQTLRNRFHCLSGSGSSSARAQPAHDRRHGLWLH